MSTNNVDNLLISSQGIVPRCTADSFHIIPSTTSTGILAAMYVYKMHGSRHFNSCPYVLHSAITPDGHMPTLMYLNNHAWRNSPGCQGHGLTRFLGLAILLYSKDTCWPVFVAI